MQTISSSGVELSIRGALVHWVQDAEEAPFWTEAHRRLKQEGRRSRVSHPSEAHRRFEMPEPRAGGEFVFKTPLKPYAASSTG